MTEDATFSYTMPTEIREALYRGQQAELWRALFAEMGRQALEQVQGSADIMFLTDPDLFDLLSVLGLEEIDIQGTTGLVAGSHVSVGVLQRFPGTIDGELHLCVFDAKGEYQGNQVLNRADLASLVED